MSRHASRVAIVTGAGQGIGRAIAHRLAADGATVAACDLRETGAHETAAALGGEAAGIPTDVTDRASVESMVQQVVDRWGRIDVLVNDAGWDKTAAFVDSRIEDWDQAIQVNLYGVLHTCQVVLPHMIDAGAGRIVNIGSDAGRVGSSGEAVYSAAKGGVIAVSKTIAREVARHGITVNCVSPGPTDTALFEAITADSPGLRDALTKAIPLRRLAQPEDLAGAVAFLASDDAAYITGQTLSVSGGLTMS